MEELIIIEGQLGVLELVSCRRASNCDFLDLSRTWILSICCCPHSCRRQILTLVVSVHSTVCTLKTRRVRFIRSNPSARELALVYRLGGVDSRLSQSRSGHTKVPCQRCLEGGGPCLCREGRRCPSTYLVPHCEHRRDVLHTGVHPEPEPRLTAVAPVPPARQLAQCRVGGLVLRLRQHQVPSPRSIRFGVTSTGGRMAGATLHHLRTSPRVGVGTHQQVPLRRNPVLDQR